MPICAIESILSQISWLTEDSVEEVFSPMQKGLCIAALAISVIVFVLFLLDLVLGLVGQDMIAPFRFANMTIDIVFTVCSAILGVLSWFTYREQV